MMDGEEGREEGTEHGAEKQRALRAAVGRASAEQAGEDDVEGSGAGQ